MQNLFYKRGHNGRISLTTIPQIRRERWADDFEEGRGSYFYAAVLFGAVGFYVFVWLAMAIF